MPLEASMHPANRPRPPGPTVFIRIASPRIPLAWEPYLVPRARAQAQAAAA
jgi:hypothetical protein